MEKTCLNPECRKVIVEYKSSKKTYCNDHCRNRAGYINRSIENKELITFQKGLKNNAKLLKQFVDRKFEKIPFAIISQLGFNANHLPNGFYASLNRNKQHVFQLNNIIFSFNKDTNDIIIHKP